MQFYTNKAILLSYIPAGPVCQKQNQRITPFFWLHFNLCSCLSLFDLKKKIWKITLQWLSHLLNSSIKVKLKVIEIC